MRYIDLVPAKDSSGTVGLYDTVGDGNFLTKSTTSGSLTDALIDKTFDVTGRTLETGTRIMEWGAKPQNVTFAFVPSGAEPVVGGTGLFYGLVGNDAEFAWWTGAGHDGDPTNPANWAQALPTSRNPTLTEPVCPQPPRLPEAPPPISSTTTMLEVAWTGICRSASRQMAILDGLSRRTNFSAADFRLISTNTTIIWITP